MKKRFTLLSGIILLSLLILSFPIVGEQTNFSLNPQPIRNFSFLHISDIHVSPSFSMPANMESQRSYATISKIKNLGEVLLTPYNVLAPKPSFIIVTGDIAEFSFPGVTWQVLAKYFEGVAIPIYYSPGNHDNTWVSDTEMFRNLYGGLHYSFNYGGCHFISLDSATIQDPVPSFGEEAVAFLKNDLKKIDLSTPVFLFCHHPLDGGEFCSRYDVDRVIDALRGYNVVLIMDGHGHSAVHHDFWGIDGVEGGSPFDDKDSAKSGFNIICIKDREIFVAYKKNNEAEATKEILKKKIPDRLPYPAITIYSPGESEIVKGESLTLHASISEEVRSLAGASYSIDDELMGSIPYTGYEAKTSVQTNQMCNGAHFIRFTFKDAEGKEYYKSRAFFIENPKAEKMGSAKWRFQMGGASKATPLYYQGAIYVGSNDGYFYALEAETGNLKWKFPAGAEILSSATVWKDKILFGAGNGKFFAVDPLGKEVWSFEAQAAIYSSPVVDNKGIVYFGTNKANLFAVDTEKGNLVWKNEDARFSIESKPFVTEDSVYFGAWDGYLYCVNKSDGKLKWKSPGPKNQARVNTYYAPADNGPVVTSGTIFLTDRGYVAGAYDLQGGYKATLDTSCSAIGLSENAGAIYQRCLKNPVRKMDLNGNLLWKSAVTGGRIPVSPLERNGIVYVCSNSGRLYALHADNGSILWEYQATPQLYVMSGVETGGNLVFTTGMDGCVTAIFKK